MKRLCIGAAVVVGTLGIASAALAGGPAIISNEEMDLIVGGEATIEAPVTAATTIHGAPGNTPGFGGSSANPEGEGVNGGDGIHNIDANWGIADDANTDIDPGSQGGPADEMHGGLNAWTGQF